MNKFPTPPPDRRLNKLYSNTRTAEPLNSSKDFDLRSSDIIQNPQKSLKNSQIFQSIPNSNKNVMSDSFEKEDCERSSNLNLLKKKHIEDMRNSILSYKLLNEKRMFLNSNVSVNINKCNIILFGPSGSGKSSFIHTLYKAVYGTSHLPPDVVNKLIIKQRDQNEGTLCFTRLHLKEESSQTSGIIVCDTRGHIWMNEEEREQFKVIMEGNVKEDTEVVQVKNRNPLLLWEFWKKDAEMFPKEIFNAKEIGLDSIPHNIVFVFDGSSDEVIDQNDEKFYKELVEFSYRKGKEIIFKCLGYAAVHIILTRIDIFERQIYEKFKNLQYTERNTMLNSLKDQKIERVIDVLGVKRSDVHFIENYHNETNENDVEIDYQALKTVGDLINLAEQFILSSLNKNATCFAKCF